MSFHPEEVEFLARNFDVVYDVKNDYDTAYAEYQAVLIFLKVTMVKEARAWIVPSRFFWSLICLNPCFFLVIN
jgi:hypothetical protein